MKRLPAMIIVGLSLIGCGPKNTFEYEGNPLIRDFSTRWNIVRMLVSMELKKYEKLYRDNKDFREYVDRYMRNKEDVKLKDVLRMKQTQLVGDMYEKESHEKSS